MTSTLYLGDCLDILKTIPPVDAVITDPVWPNAPAGMFNVDDPCKLLAGALNLIDAKRVVIILRSDSDPRFLSAVPDRYPFFRVQVLEYRIPGYIGRKLGGMEIAYCFGEPVPSAPGRRVIPGNAPKAGVSSSNGHACPRSEAHMRWLVNWWAEPGEVVLDPFAGSGTTGAACVKLNRNFIGIEIDPQYYAIAKKRIADAEQQMIFDFEKGND